jgi:hypothetical protein
MISYVNSMFRDMLFEQETVTENVMSRSAKTWKLCTRIEGIIWLCLKDTRVRMHAHKTKYCASLYPKELSLQLRFMCVYVCSNQMKKRQKYVFEWVSSKNKFP